MIIIGVTGPSGAGKSLFCTYIAQQGFSMIDADRVYHSLLCPPSPCLDGIRAAFGDRIFFPDGTLDRKSLAHVVFSSEKKLELLNSTVLGFVLERIRQMISEFESMGKSVVFVDAPTLIESGFNRECDSVVSVLASKEIRIERISQRDGITREKALERINAQKDDEFYISHSHHVLYNDSGDEELKNDISRLLEKLFKEENI